MPMRLSQAGSLGHRACRVARFRIVRCSSAVSKPVATDAQSATAKQEAGNKPETGLILDLGIPTLLPEWRKMFAPSTVVTDVTAGITVGCVAVPLSLAIAVASGVPPEVGLVSAAVAGVAGGLMGGTTLAITGPAAAISLLVCEAVQTHGLGTLPFITLACGGLQLAMGVARGGGITEYVPESVIAGFTTGIGVMILAGQLPKALDLTVPAGLNTVEVVQAVASGIGGTNPAALALALGVVGTMHAAPKLHPKIPSALVAVGGATAASQLLGLSATPIGALPSGLSAFTLCMPALPAAEALPSLCGTILLIYAMTSAETRLSREAEHVFSYSNGAREGPCSAVFRRLPLPSLSSHPPRTHALL